MLKHHCKSDLNAIMKSTEYTVRERDGGSDIEFGGYSDESLQQCIDGFSVLYQKNLALCHHNTFIVPDGIAAPAILDILEDFRSHHPSVAINLGDSERKATVFGYKNDVELSSLLRKELTECSTASLRESIWTLSNQNIRKISRSTDCKYRSPIFRRKNLSWNGSDFGAIRFSL